MKKKLVATMLSAALIMTMLAGCGSSSSDSSEGAKAEETENAEDEADAGTDSPEDVMVISVTNVLADNSPENTALQSFKAEIEEKSGGRMKVEIYANGIMGGEMENVENVRNNNVTMTMAATSVLANFVPECELFDLPYAFPTVEIGTKALNDAEIRDALNAALRKRTCYVVRIRRITAG